MKPLSEVFAAVLLLAGLAAPAAAETPKLYREHCASCHGEGRLGGIGPALLPQNMGRLKGEAITRVIAEGREATQMPAFGQVL